MIEKVTSLKKTARLAGFLYLALALTGTYSLIISTSPIIKEIASESSTTMSTNEFVYRSSVVSHLASVIFFLFLALVLYRLLRSVNDHYAKQMVALVVVQVPIIFIIEACRFTALMLIKGEVLQTSSPEQVTHLSALLFKIHSYGIHFVKIFWGLWLLPFGLLVYKSRFIPRILGFLLFAAGIGYTADSLAFLLYPALQQFTTRPALILSGVSELGTIFWFLIKGVRDHISIDVIAAKQTEISVTLNKVQAE